MSCQKCSAKFGITIEDELGTLCAKCHPTIISNPLDPNEWFEKFVQHLKFNKVARTIFNEEDKK